MKSPLAKTSVKSSSFSLLFSFSRNQAKAWTLDACCFVLWFIFCFMPVSGFGQSVVFRDVAVESGLKFQHFTGATGDLFMPEIMGSGCVLFDYDNDGDLDATA